MSIFKDLQELQKQGVLDAATADKITAYYDNKTSKAPNRILILFAVLGAILVGTGLIMVIAHNWDQLNKTIKLAFAFLPLLIGQFFCYWSATKRKSNIGWREGASAFLFIAIGVSISVVSQVYNLPENTSTFLFIWSLLGLPIIYIMQSLSTFIIYLILTALFVLSCFDYGQHPSNAISIHWYWALFAGILPYYYLQSKQFPNTAVVWIKHWLVPITLCITATAIHDKSESLFALVYVCLFSVFISISNIPYFFQLKIGAHGYKIIGVAGIVILGLIFSFPDYWKSSHYSITVKKINSESIAFWFLFVTNLGILIYRTVIQNNKLHLLEFSFAIFAFIYLLRGNANLTAVMVNIFLFIIGLVYILQGSKQDHLGYLNLGMIILSALILCRFFDSNLQFLTKGIIFILVGFGFFISNYLIIKKRKNIA